MRKRVTSPAENTHENSALSKIFRLCAVTRITPKRNKNVLVLYIGDGIR